MRGEALAEAIVSVESATEVQLLLVLSVDRIAARLVIASGEVAARGRFRLALPGGRWR